MTPSARNEKAIYTINTLLSNWLSSGNILKYLSPISDNDPKAGVHNDISQSIVCTKASIYFLYSTHCSLKHKLLPLFKSCTLNLLATFWLFMGCLLGWGILTLTWYTYMCLPFGRFFAKFGIAIGGLHQRPRSPNYINWVYFGKIITKSTQFDQNWVLFFWKWHIDGWEIRQKIGIEKVWFSRSSRHIPVQFWRKQPPRVVRLGFTKHHLSPWHHFMVNGWDLITMDRRLCWPM